MAENPYSRLRREATDWIAKVLSRRPIFMWRYGDEDLKKLWKLDDLVERVQAADQLGFDVRLRYVKGEGLISEYIARLPSTPYWY